MGSPVITNSELVKVMERMNDNIYTTYLEVFHSVKIRYVPKQIFFEQDKMVAGTALEALDFNHNVNRSQVIHRFIVSQILSESLVIPYRTKLRRTKFFVRQNFRHLQKISSLLSDEV